MLPGSAAHCLTGTRAHPSHATMSVISSSLSTHALITSLSTEIELDIIMCVFYLTESYANRW